MHYPDISNSLIDQLFTAATVFFIITGVGGPILGIPGFGRSGQLMAYSKFAENLSGSSSPSVSSRLGMLVLYMPSSIVGALALAAGWVMSDRGQLAAVMMFLHFGKRSTECLFLHKFSGSMPLATSLFISTIYAIATCLICYYAELVGGAPQASRQSFAIFLFLTGLVGNLYHHWLLANLRKPGETGYKVPRGGFFEHVAAPHYFFELVGWAGVAYLTDHLMPVCMFLGMSGYLVDRAKAQSSYNRKKIDGYPRSRGHIIPFVY